MNVDLIDPIDVEIEQIDKTATPFPDGMSGRKFPQNNVVRKEKFTIKAQVVFGDRQQKQNMTQLGTDEQRKGYMILKLKDLNALGKTLQRGDKVVKMGQFQTELYFTHSSGDLAAHTGGEFNLVRMPFMDRKPVGEA